MMVAELSRIENAANDLLRLFWLKRDKIWRNPPDPDGLLPIPVDVIVRDVLDLRLDEPEEIPAEHRSREVETAGFIDRAERRIVVAQKYRWEWRRFTMAHEIGHWVLHEDERYHRDRPLTGGERANSTRPRIELEADIFAAELLMPRKALTRKFIESFGSRFDGRQPNSDTAFWLSAGTGHAVNEIRLSSDLRYRAMVIAETKSFSRRHFTPLTKTFGVSVTAMAIQLENLRLVM